MFIHTCMLEKKTRKKVEKAIYNPSRKVKQKQKNLLPFAHVMHFVSTCVKGACT